MVRKGCNSLVRAEKILTHIAWVGMASYMELLNKFQYPKSSLLNLLNVEAGFTATARACEAHPLLLALEDTTTNPKTRGLLAHSVLMYAPDSTLPVGLIEQQRWSRATDTYGVKHQRKERPCEEKESYRWQQASERMAERLGEIQKRAITVCDREADIWHYLHYKVSHGQRFVVRAAQNRRLERSTRQALRTAGSPGNRGKSHAECDAKRRAGSPPGPDVHQLQRSQHKKSRQQRPGAPAHVCLFPGAGRGRCLLASADVRKSGECRRCATYRQPLRATLADRGIPQGVEKWWYMYGIAANADPG